MASRSSWTSSTRSWASAVTKCSHSSCTSMTSSTMMARRCLSARRSQTNSRNYMLADTLVSRDARHLFGLQEHPLVYQSEVSLGNEKSGAYVSVYLRTQTPHSFVSARMCCRSSTATSLITPRSSPRPTRRPSRRNALYTSSTRSPSSSHSPQRETLPPLPDQQHQH